MKKAAKAKPAKQGMTSKATPKQAARKKSAAPRQAAPVKTSSARKAPEKKSPARGTATLANALAWLTKTGKPQNIAGHERFGIIARQPFGVTVGELGKYAKTLGRNHALARQLFATQRYEAQLLAAFLGEPGQLTAAEMNAWADDFDNWAIVDTVCFHLFDRTPLAWKLIPQWAKAKAEFKKRAAFALLWSLSMHDKAATDKAFTDGLKLIEAGATDERHFVKKAVNMALRAIGKRNAALHKAASDTATRLSQSKADSARWVGKDALRELNSPAVRKRLKKARK